MKRFECFNYIKYEMGPLVESEDVDMSELDDEEPELDDYLKELLYKYHNPREAPLFVGEEYVPHAPRETPLFVVEETAIPDTPEGIVSFNPHERRPGDLSRHRRIRPRDYDASSASSDPPSSSVVRAPFFPPRNHYMVQLLCPGIFCNLTSNSR